jgi:hypothetical protein
MAVAMYIFIVLHTIFENEIILESLTPLIT